MTVGSQTTLGPTGGLENASIPPTMSVSDDFIKQVGKHTFSFGAMFVNGESNYTGFAQAALNFNGTFTQGPNPELPSADTGNGFAQMLMGVLDGGNTENLSNPAYTRRLWGEYLQDDYRILPNLTLNLGVRYEITGAPTTRGNDGSVFNPNVVNPISTDVGETLLGALQFLTPSNRGMYHTRYDNWAPRVGFSYEPVSKLVVHGGYGIFYPLSVYMNGEGEGLDDLDGFSATTDVPYLNPVNGVSPNPAVSLANPFPEGYVKVTGNSLGELQDVGLSPQTIFVNRLSSYTQQWTLGFQYALASNDSIDIAYVGNRGIHLPFSTLNPDQLNPQYLSMGATALDAEVTNPFYGSVTQSSCNLNESTVAAHQLLQPYPQFCGVTENYPQKGFDFYDALQANYRHRFTHGLDATISYTFSKFIDNTDGTQAWSYVGGSGVANNYNLAAEKSVSGGDTPQSIVANYSYYLPVGKNKAWGSNFNRTTNAIVGGWQVTGIYTFRSGLPLGISGNNWNSYGGNPRPDVIGNLHVAHRTIHEWFNTGAYNYAPYGTFGTVPRFQPDLRGPTYTDFDTGLMKNWDFARETRLQFRAEMFNTFNHPQFYSPNTGYPGCDPNVDASCVSSFGQITAAFPGREVQMSGKFYW